MKIKPKVSEVPRPTHTRQGKYEAIWKLVRTLGKGEFLPVEFATRREAANLQICAITHRTLGVKATVRNCTVYLSCERNGKRP